MSTMPTTMIVASSAVLCLAIVYRLWREVVRDLAVLLWKASDDLQNLCNEVMKKHGGTYVFKGPKFCNFDFVTTCDHRNARHIFSTNFRNYERGQDFNYMFEVLGDGIFNVDGELWKYQRQLLQSLIGSNNEEFERHMMETLRDKTETALFPALDDAASSSRLQGRSEVVDVQDVGKRFLFDAICLLVLGFDPEEMSSSASWAVKACDEITEAVAFRHIVPVWMLRLQNWFQVGTEKRMRRSWRAMDRFLYRCVKTRKQELALANNDKSKGKDYHQPRPRFDLLTQCLMVEEDGEGEGEAVVEKQSDKFLRDTALTLILAGKETISSGLVWLLWLVATHPHVERAILDEIEQFVAVNGKAAFWSKGELTTNKMVYLHAAICETLRLYPPVPFQHRCAMGEDLLPSGHRVRKGARMIFSICSMARMPQIWGEDCAEFKPERWIDRGTGTILPVPSHKFMTFMTGPRTCLGRAMSFLLLKSLASAILWNYKFEVVEGHHVKPALSVVTSMKHGLKMRVSKRR
ncbi:unnamed protein product [Linum tenue]|uniref:Cytochrome P450 n=1 Tax=Linum tenue TaxID=586396 RepID=A0AAV0N8I7_9ROSI|nr:unnamed protein product [Linum tenue]